MKAVLLTGYGDVDKFEYADVPDPNPGPGEVLVRVVSTSVNPLDYKLRRGAMKAVMPLQFPFILGSDAAGEVTRLGEGVDRFKPGDKVMGLVNRGYAEYLVAKADILSFVPEALPLSEAGCLPVVTLAGSQLLERGVQPSAGQTVLVTGAVGAVGRSAVYAAKTRGARVIAGVRARQKSEAQALGAHSVVALDDDAEIAAMPSFDCVADCIGGEVASKILPKWNRKGKYASVVGKPEAAERAGVDVVMVFTQPDPKRLAELAADVVASKLRIPIAKKLPLSEIREAHRLAESGAPGKIVLLP